MRRVWNVRAIAASVCLVGSLSCVGGESPTQADPPVSMRPQLSLIPSASDASAAPINRIRAVGTKDFDGSILGEAVLDVDPNAVEWAVDLPLLGADGVAVRVYLYLINVAADGTEDIQFSGVSAPILVSDGAQATPVVPIVRGPLANVFVTSVAVTGAPTLLIEGQTATLGATVGVTQGSAPTVFWTALDSAVLTVSDSTVTATSVGLGRVVASAGAFADTVLIEVLPMDQTPPTINGLSPASGAVGVDLSTVVTASFSEAMDAASVIGAFTLRDSLGVIVPATVTYANQVGTLTPTSQLDTLHTYTAEISTTATDSVGNALVASVTWAFTTSAGASLLTSFNLGIGTLVAVAFDNRSGNLFIQNDFELFTQEFTTAGVEVLPTIATPGPSSNDIDLDFADVATGLNGTGVPVNSLFVLNGEVSPTVLYAVNKNDGAVLDSLTLPVTGQMVGGSFHPGRGTFFTVDWQSDVIHEIDPVTGQLIATFPPQPLGSPAFSIFFGDLEVDPTTGNLLVVSSDQSTIRVLSPTGAFVKDVPVGNLGISQMAGIAWDNATATAWIVTTGSDVYQVAGIR